MKVSYSLLNTGASSNVSNDSVNSFGSKIIILVPVFIFAVVLVGFYSELLTVEKLNLFIAVPLNRTSYPNHNSAKTFKTFQLQQLVGQHVKSTMSDWNSTTLFNISDFHWIRNNKSICQIDKRHPNSKILPILVHTARSHYADRLTIRKSWGSLLFYKNWSIRLIFLIGEADRGVDPFRNVEKFQEQEALLDKEQSMFGDIVQGSFIDSYRNLTYKHIMGYKWILNFCSNATFVLKADDDIFIDVMRFLNWRNDDLKDVSESFSLPELYCSTFVGTRPQRCLGCKWYISENDWPLDYYPDYCSGMCYGITVDLIRKLYGVLDKAQFFWVDDVFATGVLLEELKKAVPGFEPQYRHLWGQVRTLDFKNFRPMCERHDISMKRKFGAVVPIPRGSNFERDLMCLWNKTVYDDDREQSYEMQNFYD